ncbi:protein trichome birefringence-like [Rutidosis leptorrhynchoides]|uniref:protein trichome birefringence-like n=1 Tax=Rutidosis leptorrhynchoides TaxID=125765 RepID=UPI003A994F09
MLTRLHYHLLSLSKNTLQKNCTLCFTLMAESTKYMPVVNPSSTTVVSDIKFTKKLFSFRTSKKTRTFAYVFISIFVAFTVFLAFNPSPNPSSPWFSNIFSSSTFSTTVKANSTTSTSVDSVRSHFSSIYSYFFANNSSQPITYYSLNSTNFSGSNHAPPTVDNDRNITHSEGVKSNQSRISHSSSQILSNLTSEIRSNQSVVTVKNGTDDGVKSENLLKSNNVTDNGAKSGQKSDSGNGAKSDNSVKSNGTEGAVKLSPKSVNKGDNDDEVKQLVNCDLFDGDWVRDETYPLYKPGSCSLIDEQFNCFRNGRPDKGFQMLKWKPNSCTLPRLDGNKMLQLLRGKRLVFVGDSLNRNMWESLICILRNSVKDQTRVYEASGRHHFRTEPSYSFVFKDYDCTVEFFVAPFIVRESETQDKNGVKKETLRLDLVGASADQYKNADIVVFNTGHWWTHDKTAKGKDYYQEGSHVYGELNVLEAFRKAMTTWGRWVDANIKPSKTMVFFRGYSASHFRGGQWNSGGQCDNEVNPIKNTSYLSPYPDKMKVLERVLKGMKTRVSYLNITRLTDFRKDGHPSIYRKQHYSEQERRSPLHFQDCSHWCLPGVPDSWNEILYAKLLSKQYQSQQQKN